MKSQNIGSTGIDLEHYFRLLMRQKWFLIYPAIVGVVASAAISLTLPNLYSAKSTILVEPQSLPSQFMSSALPYGPETYVRSLVEQIKSRSRLEKVIREYDLYPQMRATKPMEEVVAAMREAIEIERKGQDTFSIAYTGADPEKVEAVTNTLTEMFIQENTHFRLERSAQNVTFLKSQAQKLRQEVSDQEKLIQEYKSRHLETLPDQRMATQVQLNAAQQRLQSTAEALSSARAKVAAAREQQGLLSEPHSLGAGVGLSTSGDRDPLQEQLISARKELVQLKSRLSDKHPDVRIKQNEIDELEAQLAAGTGKSRAPRVTRRAPRSPELLRAYEDEKIAQAEIARLTSEQARLETQIATLNARLEATPKVELELSELTKGVEVLKEQADSFQKKATEAEASLEMERGNQGSQFRALDRAQLPHKPISPNRPLIVLIGAFSGIFVGFVLVIGMDLLFRPFLDEQDLARFAGVQVLVSIPHVGPFPSEWQRFRGQVSNLLGYLLGSLAFGEEEYQPRGLSAPDGPPAPPLQGQAATNPSGQATVNGARGHKTTPGRGVETTKAGPPRGATYRDAPPITRAATRGHVHQSPANGERVGNGRMVYSSSIISGGGMERGGPVSHPATDHEPSRRPTTVVVHEVATGSDPGHSVAITKGESWNPGSTETDPSLENVDGGPRSVVLSGRWRSPTRYVIRTRPGARTVSGAEETMKELYRRAPWIDGKES